jgi:hypothetical protein
MSELENIKVKYKQLKYYSGKIVPYSLLISIGGTIEAEYYDEHDCRKAIFSRLIPYIGEKMSIETLDLYNQKTDIKIATIQEINLNYMVDDKNIPTVLLQWVEK